MGMKEADIRPRKLFRKYLELCARDARDCFSQARRRTAPCPGCGGRKAEPAFEKHGFGYVVCNTCATLYQSPRPLRESFSKFYSNSPSARFWAEEFLPVVAEARREKIFRPRVELIRRRCTELGLTGGALVDIGAGSGLFLAEWHRAAPDWRLIAVEPGPQSAAACRNQGFEVHQTFVEDSTDLTGAADLGVAFEVVEHAHDPLLFCRAVRRLIRPGGVALFTGLTVDGFDIQTLWNKSEAITPPHHINFMSIAGFRNLMIRAGFDGVEIQTPGKLDVDIVLNAYRENPGNIGPNRPLEWILSRSEAVRNDFQKFLSDHQMSSHCWVWGLVK